MKNLINVTENRYEKTNNEKWKKQTTEKYTFTQEQYENFTSKEARKFFIALGGKEYSQYANRKIKAHTSISPDRQTKVVWTFDFEN